MGNVDVVFTINGADDKYDDHDFRVMDELERMYPVTRQFSRTGILAVADRALKRDQALHPTWLGRRPILLDNVLTCQGHYDEMVVVLPLGATWPAVNSAYQYLHHRGYELDADSDLRDHAHQHIVPLLDTRGEFSRYPFDHKIAFDIMYTMRLALGKGRVGRGKVSTIESFRFNIPQAAEVDDPCPRESGQLGLLFKFEKLPC